MPRRIDTIDRKPRGGHYKDHEDRRMEILRLFCAGKLLKQIAGILKTREGNVSYAISKLMRENNLKTHAQLGVWAQRKGILEPSAADFCDSQVTRGGGTIESRP